MVPQVLIKPWAAYMGKPIKYLQGFAKNRSSIPELLILHEAWIEHFQVPVLIQWRIMSDWVCLRSYVAHDSFDWLIGPHPLYRLSYFASNCVQNYQTLSWLVSINLEKEQVYF